VSPAYGRMSQRQITELRRLSAVRLQQQQAAEAGD
jgi:hypothetical protein